MSACQPAHAIYCFDVLAAHLNGHQPSDASKHGIDPTSSYPLFVTWKIKEHRSDRDYALRGCIGNFSTLNLRRGLREYSLTSALQDIRFSPITLKEFSKLQCTVSLLTDFEECEDHLDWTVGVHGVRMEMLASGKRAYSATFLPEVAEEQEWTKEETFMQLIKKSGYRGQIDAGVMGGLKVTRYQSSICSVTHDDYLLWEKANRKGDLLVDGCQ